MEMQLKIPLYTYTGQEIKPNRQYLIFSSETGNTFVSLVSENKVVCLLSIKDLQDVVNALRELTQENYYG